MSTSTFSIPAFSETDLQKLVDSDNEGFPAVGVAQARHLGYLAEIDGTEVTPSRLGWMALWSRTWELLTALRLGLGAENRFVLSATFRSALELYLHCHVLIEPLMSPKDGSPPLPTAPDASADRLCGFLAWCLNEDRATAAKVMATLHDVYEGESAAKIRRDPKSLALHEAFFGELPLSNQHELDRDRQRHHDYLKREATWIESVLSHPSLQRWTSQLRANKGSSRQSLYQLLGSVGTGPRDRLTELDVEFIYPQYSMHSQLLHGSSVIQFIVRGPGTASPALGRAAGDEDSFATGALDHLIRTSVNLFILRGHLWPQQ